MVLGCTCCHGQHAGEERQPALEEQNLARLTVWTIELERSGILDIICCTHFNRFQGLDLTWEKWILIFVSFTRRRLHHPLTPKKCNWVFSWTCWVWCEAVGMRVYIKQCRSSKIITIIIIIILLVPARVEQGKDYNAWLRFRKLFHTKEESTKEFEVRRWQLLELDHADPLRGNVVIQ